MVRVYNNLELITLVYNKELQDGDMIFVMPSNIDLAKQAVNTPYIYRNGSLSSDDTDEDWVYEEGTYWTINEIHHWLEPYVNEVYK